MTDQPTTWTPERALEMLRDFVSPMSAAVFGKKWGAFGELTMADVAIAALESAAAEIAKEKALTEKALRDGQEMTAGLHELVASLRAELAAKQPAEAEAAQQGPSDEEIREQLLRVVFNSQADGRREEIYHALRMIAQRAGVKL